MRCTWTPAVGFAIFTALAACSSPSGPNEVAGTNPAPNAKDGGATPADAGAPAPAGDGGAKVTLSPVHFIGRFDTQNADGPRASWPGVQIRTRFSGTGATLRIRVAGTKNGTKTTFDQLDVSIDGAAPTILKPTDATESYPIASGLPDSDHDVVVTKRTESFGMIQYLGIDSTEGRPLVPTPPPFSRYIEFVGDSITCGYGVLGANASCSFSADTESEPAAYAALTASALSAGHSSVAFSGIGMYRNSAGSTTDQMPVRFFRALAGDETSLWDFHITPDVVVVNLGANDYRSASVSGSLSAAFEEAYTSFLVKLREKYPQAYFIAALSSMMTESSSAGIKNRGPLKTSLTKIVQARTTAGDQRVSFFEFDEQSASDGYGCENHPSQATQKRDSAKLVAYIKTLTGW
ncbi:MAG TPA: SGNH/GDSL hydrolase family protein [Labilithrix sp.]|nr:SGNH/GDSL hydrolase family protein [Labilithrix sp.]